MGDNDEQNDRARVHWSVPPPPGLTGGETEAPGLGEEFLFHLYRGSELLKEDHFYEAKGELERALSFRPRDVEGQSLLGVVYFRLGHYPRAIQIYEELIRVRPTEVAPRINLALCYLKTGQLPSARSLLEELVQRRPDHVRAWGYLGLAYQRLGDKEKASVAFERAGRPRLAARLRNGRSQPPPPEVPAEAHDGDGVREIEHRHVRAALTVPPPPVTEASGDVARAEAPLSVPPPPESVRGDGAAAPSAPPPGPPKSVRVPLPLGRLVRDAALVFPELPRVVVHESGAVLVRVDRAFHARSDCVRAALPDEGRTFATRVLRRRGRGLLADEPLGGLTAPFATLEGEGRLVLGAPAPFVAFASRLEGEPLYAREERLLGFDGAVEHEFGRIAMPEGEYAGIVHLVGSGFVVLAIQGKIHGLEISSERPAEVRAASLVGWVGRLLARPSGPGEERVPLRGLVTLSGSGVALMDGG